MGRYARNFISVQEPFSRRSCVFHIMSKKNEGLRIVDLAIDQVRISEFLAKRGNLGRVAGGLIRLRLQEEDKRSRSKIDQELEYTRPALQDG